MNSLDRKRRLRELAAQLVESYENDGEINRSGEKDLPGSSDVVEILEQLLALLFPGYRGRPVPADADLELLTGARLDRVGRRLDDVIERTLRFCHRTGCQCEELWSFAGEPVADDRFADAARQVSVSLLAELPAIRHLLSRDVRAAFEGDPAAANEEEIILCYPGVLAIAVHRLAHPLYRLGVPLLPRMMSEWAHHASGVDIHPGAVIGEAFFIDHGTGVVIGETTEIGERVKIYQGVTLGALSFPRNPDGTLVKGGKRHPTIGDGVTIYANATILGGGTVVGDGAVIGGGAWVTDSVAPGEKVTVG